METQLQIEKYVEAALVTDGHSPGSVFDKKRHKIRGFLFYLGGTALSESTYAHHLKEIREYGTRQSVPYRRIMRAPHNYDLFSPKNTF